MRKYFLLYIFFFFIGCGYKPTVNITNEILKGNVYIDVPIDIHNIENSILIRESLIDMFSNKFNMIVVNEKSKADLYATGKIFLITHEALESDLGYVKLFRETVTIQVEFSDKKSLKKSYKATDYYDYSIDDESILSERRKNDAIKEAIKNALSSIPPQIALSLLKNEQKEN